MNAEGRPALPVVYAPLAIQDLDAIWNWNEKTYGPSHAARYIDFLERCIIALGKNYDRGRVLESRSELRYIQLRQRTRGHSHIVVYRVDDGAVVVLHIFHTAQNWLTKLAEEDPHN